MGVIHQPEQVNGKNIQRRQAANAAYEAKYKENQQLSGRVVGNLVSAYASAATAELGLGSLQRLRI